MNSARSHFSPFSYRRSRVLLSPSNLLAPGHICQRVKLASVFNSWGGVIIRLGKSLAGKSAEYHCVPYRSMHWKEQSCTSRGFFTYLNCNFHQNQWELHSPSQCGIGTLFCIGRRQGMMWTNLVSDWISPIRCFLNDQLDLILLLSQCCGRENVRGGLVLNNNNLKDGL